jgi:putative ABC transport system permease protein
MLKNYFKIAIAVLKRRKFFTFISLFGISFTLTILIVITAFWDHATSAKYPDTKRDRSLYVVYVILRGSKNGFMNSGPVSLHFLNTYISKMKTPTDIAISSMFGPTNTYINNKKLVIDLKYTNDAFWKVLEYEFLEGKPYTKQQIDNGERVAVISEDTKRNYFGDVPAVVGKYLVTNNEQYRVIGVVKNVPVTLPFVYSNMYVPYTLSPRDLVDKSFGGKYLAILLAKSKADLPAMKEEFTQLLKRIPVKGERFDQISGSADNYLEVFTRAFFGNESNTGITRFITIMSLFVFTFMLLPTLNLVNINISRIMERSSEIGVRKAFGASSGTLTIQFIVENLVLTFLGGIIGVVLSWGILQIINSYQLIPNVHLTINITVLLASFMACMIFGLLSGVYPAWRMSRMQIVTALKA